MDENIDPNSEVFEFPKGLLDQISECSPEGFLLFTINEFGEIEFYSKSMPDVIETGLRTKALKILTTLSQVEDSDMTSNILHQRQPEEQDGEDGLIS